MVKVKCIQKFYDVKADADRLPGDEWEVSDARAKEINSSRYGDLVEVVSKAKAKPKKEAE